MSKQLTALKEQSQKRNRTQRHRRPTSLSEHGDSLRDTQLEGGQRNNQRPNRIDACSVAHKTPVRTREGGHGRRSNVDSQPSHQQQTDTFGTASRTGLRQRERGRRPAKGREVSLNAACLNFHYEGRQSERNRRPFRREGRRPAVGHKEFLHANFKFSVSDAVDTAAFHRDPDRMFNWQDVLHVELPVAEDIRCPISLEQPPVCPHITPCGHVFSFPSIIHHLMIASNGTLTNTAACPLCYVPFSACALRSVSLQKKPVPKVGELWTFSLMKREEESAVAMRISETGMEEPLEKFVVAEDSTKHFEAIAAKLADAMNEAVQGSDDTMELQSYLLCVDNLCSRAIDFEKRRLNKLRKEGHVQMTSEQVALAAEKADLAIRDVFYQRAGSILEPSTEGCVQHPFARSAQESTERPHLIPDADIGTIDLAADEDDWDAEPDFATEKDDMLLQFESLDVKEDPAPLPDAPAHEEEEKHRGKAFHFHQSEDGQWIFLHPVNIQCLLQHYGRYDHFPRTLTGRVVDIEEVVQTDKTRHRMRYLTHLPKQALIQLVEIDLTNQIPRSCLRPAFNKQKRKKAKQKKEEEAMEFQIQDHLQDTSGFRPRHLDMESMPPLTEDTPALVPPEGQKKTGAFSFANVTKNGHIPKMPNDATLSVQGETAERGLQHLQPKAWKGKKKVRGAKVVVFSNASMRK